MEPIVRVEHQRKESIGREALTTEEELQEVSFTDLLSTLGAFRLPIALLTLAFACVVGLLVVPQLVPARSFSHLKFQLEFSGADAGRYPNGTPFSSAEIVAPLILEAVYEAQDLQQYGLTPAAFRDRISIRKSDEGLAFLEQKYATRLAAKTLSPEERQQLQNEYAAQKQKLFSGTQYVLTLRAESDAIPKEVQGQILRSVLETWARFTETDKGVYLYPVAVLTPDVFDLGDSEHIVQIDRLRRRTRRVAESAQVIASLPGALQTQSSSGANISSLQLRIGDLLRHRIAPLAGIVRRGHLYNDEQLTRIYLQEQIYNLELNAKTLEANIALLRDSLDGYIDSDDSAPARSPKPSAGAERPASLADATVIPQIGDGFFDRLVALANENQDVKYRQKITQQIVSEGRALAETRRDITYYTDLLPGDGSDRQSGLEPHFRQRYEAVLAQAKLLTAEINSVYERTSRRNLQPEQQLFSQGDIPEFRSHAIHAPKKILVVWALLVTLFFGALCCFFLLREHMRAAAA